MRTEGRDEEAAEETTAKGHYRAILGTPQRQDAKIRWKLYKSILLFSLSLSLSIKNRSRTNLYASVYVCGCVGVCGGSRFI